MKRILKEIVGLIWYVLFYRGRGHHRGLVVVTYHRVSEVPDPWDPLKVSAITLEKHIRLLKTCYHLVSAKEVEDAVRGARTLPEKACLITFDDGWEDNYTVGFPILKKYRVPALIFVATDYIGTKKRFWHVRLRAALNQPSLFSLEHKKWVSRWPKGLAELAVAALGVPGPKRGELINGLIERMKAIPARQSVTAPCYHGGRFVRCPEKVSPLLRIR
jgi:hypothetical protein